MSTFIAFLSLSLLMAVPSQARISIQTVSGEVVPDSYIVQLKPGISPSEHLSQSSAIAYGYTSEYAQILDIYNSTVYNGFSGRFAPIALRALQSSDAVKAITPNSYVNARALTTQTNAPWALSRLSSKTPLGSTDPNGYRGTYRYDSSAGAGVDIYVLDTGIYTAHADLAPRAIWGSTFGGYPDTDGNGHGTSCAGVAAGTTYGVAKKASLVAVKVLSDQGSGTTANIISGLQWAIARKKSTGRPSVIALPLGGSANTALDSAVQSAVSAGLVVVAAAGSSNSGTENTSPARVPEAITVGSSTIADARASFSNYGPGIDVYAPGVNIITTWIGSPTATNTLSGTSYSACIVSGWAAYILGLNPGFTPAQVIAEIHRLGLDGVLSNIPAGGTNELSYNGLGL